MAPGRWPSPLTPGQGGLGVWASAQSVSCLPAPAQPRRKSPPPEQRGRRTMAIELGRGARARTGHQLPALIRPLRGLRGPLDPKRGLAAGAPSGPAAQRPSGPRGVTPRRPRPIGPSPSGPAPPRGRAANEEPTRAPPPPGPAPRARPLDLSRSAEAALGEVSPQKAEEVSASCVSCAYWKSRGGRPWLSARVTCGSLCSKGGAGSLVLTPAWGSPPEAPGHVVNTVRSVHRGSAPRAGSKREQWG